MPITYHEISALRAVLRPYRSQQRIALVPTMGNLHKGHIALVELAKRHADIVVVSLFVNPTQFGIGEDFESYPRTLIKDTELLAAVGADYIFAPNVDEMYPVLPPPTSINAGAITTKLCGKSRPTHFDGVGIVVSKLFNIIQPDVAVFGQKDYQQLTIIKQLVRDLSYPIEIIAAPIVRAADGLALSSRNQYLTEDERQIAPVLQQELQRLGAQLQSSDGIAKGLETLLAQTSQRLTDAGFVVDYLALKSMSLEDIADDQLYLLARDNHDVIIAAAAWLGRARLLDNYPLTLTL